MPASLHLSPKRKRSDYNLHTPPPTSRLRTSNLPPRSEIEDDGAGLDRSPRTTVAGHLQNLDLDLDDNDDGNEMPSLHELQNPPAVPHTTTLADDPLLSNPPHHHPVVSFSLDTSTHQFNSGPQQQQQQIPLTPPKDEGEGGGEELEVPETPRLKPVSSPLLSPSPRGGGAKISSPLPSPRKQALWWSEREITGHELSDKDDDGEGINGVGFLPV
ncbi:MAG: hypothetical protein Q9191_008577 [Dirinaria sp. TL-2023a]